jgi:hypothetical protein
LVRIRDPEGRRDSVQEQLVHRILALVEVSANTQGQPNGSSVAWLGPVDCHNELLLRDSAISVLPAEDQVVIFLGEAPLCTLTTHDSGLVGQLLDRFEKSPRPEEAMASFPQVPPSELRKLIGTLERLGVLLRQAG